MRLCGAGGTIPVARAVKNFSHLHRKISTDRKKEDFLDGVSGHVGWINVVGGLNYLSKLKKLHSLVQRKINKIPENKRILITAHDAFRYFGKEYQVEVIGIQGISTLSQTSLKRRTDLSGLIIDNHIKAIFPEASVRDNQVTALIEDCKSKGYDLKTGATLYSDALGEKGTAAGDYIGMVQYNLKNIIEAVK